MKIGLGCLLVALSGCTEDRKVTDETDAGGVPSAAREQRFHTAPRPQVDALFVIDDSGSMCQEQAVFANSLEALVRRFFQADVDFRVAVVTTDMRTAGRRGAFQAGVVPPEPVLNCNDEQGGPWVPDTADCPEGLPGVLSPESSPDEATLARDLRCRVIRGTEGDGFEQGLEAMRLALSCHGPNRAAFAACCRADGTFDRTCPGAEPPSFLRPDAELLVTFLSDEDDCSDPATNPVDSRRVICQAGPGDADRDGVPDGYAAAAGCGTPAECFRAECGDLDANACQAERCAISRASNNHCAWQREVLTPVADYLDFLKALKPDEWVRVAAVVGFRALTEAGHVIEYNEGTPEPACDPDDPAYDPGRGGTEACCPQGQCTGAVQTSCESSMGEAFAGHRYLALADAFGNRGVGCPVGADPSDPSRCTSVCTGSYSQPIDLLTTWSRTLASYCLDEAPAAGSIVVEVDGVPVAFEVQDQIGCASGAVVQLSTEPPHDSEVVIRYQARG